MKKLPVIELFGPTIQGEGLMIGKRSHFVRFGGCGYRCSWCLAKGQRVLMADWSYTPIEDIHVGDLIMGLEGGEIHATPVVATHFNGLKPVVRVEPSGLLCTADHKILNIKYRRFWQRAETLVGGVIKTLRLGEITEEYKRGWLAGYLRGDGNFHLYRKRWLRVKVTSIDTVLLDTAQRYAHEMGYTLCNIVHNAGRGAHKPNNRIAGLECTFSSEVTRLQRHLYEETQTEDYLRGWLAGIFDAEGHCDKGSVRIAQQKQEVREEIVDYAQQLDFHVNIQDKVILLSPSGDFFSYCRPVLYRKYPHRLGFKRVPSCEVTAVVHTGVHTPVYDLTTIAGNYIAEGVIVHNCDSMYAVDPVQVKKNRVMMTPEEIAERLRDFSPAPWVTLTGGDPVMHDLTNLVHALHFCNFQVAVETQGQLWHNWLNFCNLVTVSPKGPSSGMEDKINHNMLQRYAGTLGSKMNLKVVVFDDNDYQFAVKLRDRYPHSKFVLSAGTDLDAQVPRAAIIYKLKWLTEKALADPSMVDVVITPQLHSLIWPNEKGR